MVNKRKCGGVIKAKINIFQNEVYFKSHKHMNRFNLVFKINYVKHILRHKFEKKIIVYFKEVQIKIKFEKQNFLMKCFSKLDDKI